MIFNHLHKNSIHVRSQSTYLHLFTQVVGACHHPSQQTFKINTCLRIILHLRFIPLQPRLFPGTYAVYCFEVCDSNLLCHYGSYPHSPALPLYKNHSWQKNTTACLPYSILTFLSLFETIRTLFNKHEIIARLQR